MAGQAKVMELINVGLLVVGVGGCGFSIGGSLARTFTFTGKLMMFVAFDKLHHDLMGSHR